LIFIRASLQRHFDILDGNKELKLFFELLIQIEASHHLLQIEAIRLISSNAPSTTPYFPEESPASGDRLDEFKGVAQSLQLSETQDTRSLGGSANKQAPRAIRKISQL
jgi:hypothetical protein